MNNPAKAASVDDNQIFPRKSDFVHQMRRTQSVFLGFFVSIDKSAPAERTDVNLKIKRAVKETISKK